LSKKWNKKKHQQQPPKNDQAPPTDGESTTARVYAVRIEPAADENDRYSDQKLYWRRQLSLAFWLNWITGFAAIVGLAGLIYLYETLGATKEAADAAKKSADISEKSFRADERPYITIYSINPKTGPLKTGDNSIDLRILNSGRTPALNIENTVHVMIAGRPIAEFAPNGKSEAVVAGSKDSVNNYTLTLSAPDARDVATLQIIGTVEYVDVFGDVQYRTTFCSWYDVKVGQFKFCPSGNDVK
jgi:hypothetical protein